jgi:hypothetical protein
VENTFGSCLCGEEFTPSLESLAQQIAQWVSSGWKNCCRWNTGHERRQVYHDIIQEYLLVYKMPGCVQLTQSQLIMIFIVQDVHQVCIKWMYILYNQRKWNYYIHTYIRTLDYRCRYEFLYHHFNLHLTSEIPV